MSSKKTHITDTDGIKVFPETTIDQIFEANGTDKFKVVQEFTEAEWDAKSDAEKAKIPLAKVLKKFVQRASAILYKDGKSVEKELDDINTKIDNIRVSTLARSWYSNHNVEGNITLNDNIDNYDVIILNAGYAGSGSVGTLTLPTGRFKQSLSGNRLQLTNGGSGYYVNNTTVKWTPVNNMYIDIFGIKIR